MNMSDLDREHLLQKIVAVSGFVFALMVLPLAQYLLVNGQSAKEQGTVAGASTDKTITDTHASLVDPKACVAKQTQDLADLQRFYDGEVANLKRNHPELDEYKAAQASLPADASAETKASFVTLIADAQASYDADLAPIQKAVDAETERLSSQDCGATAAP